MPEAGAEISEPSVPDNSSKTPRSITSGKANVASRRRRLHFATILLPLLLGEPVGGGRHSQSKPTMSRVT